jgi:hypothetical protein
VPPVAYVWLGFASADVPPSPNIQLYVIVPSGSPLPAELKEQVKSEQL